MKHLRTIVEAKLATERWGASQASRARAEIDPRSMLLVLQSLVEQGRTDEARARYAEYKAEMGAA